MAEPAADAFDVVIPSMPGYGFSSKPTTTGWGPERIARAWNVLMKRLGYKKYVAQGGDWGALISDLMGAQAPPELMAIHTNMAGVVPPPLDAPALSGAPVPAGLSGDEKHAYRLSLELIARSFNGVPEGLTRDDVLDNATLFWLTNTGVSAARLYWENKLGFFAPKGVKIPVAVSAFPDELFQAPRSWAEQAYPKLIHYNKLPKGGHFAAWEQPQLFSEEVRAGFRSLRK